MRIMMPPSERLAFTSRLAVPADIPALHRLIDRAVEDLQRPVLDAAQIAASRAFMSIDSQLIADGTYYVIIPIADPSAIVGAGGWSRRATLYGGDRSAGRDTTLLDPKTQAARIRAMFTNPAHARQGIGRAILALAEAAARAEGFTRVELVGTLSGQPLYEACGYESVEGLTDTTGGVPVPLVRMRKVF